MWTCGRGSVVCGPSRQRLLNKGARGTPLASIAEAFGCGGTKGECLLHPRLIERSSVCTASVLVSTICETVATFVVCECVRACLHNEILAEFCISLISQLRNEA